MKYKLLNFLIIFALTSTLNFAQTVQRSVIGSCGMINVSANESYLISATMGQIAVESHNLGSEWLYSGFWIPADTSITQGIITIINPISNVEWTVGDERTIQWQSNKYVEKVNIVLTRNGGKQWETLFKNMPKNGSQTWVVTMPRSDNCILRIESVSDKNVYDESGISLNPANTTGLTNPNKQPTGSTQNAYRLISVPIKLDNPSPSSVLFNDLGSYDNTKWRFFDYKNGKYLEFEESRDFEPGRSFFLIVKEEAQISADQGELIADSVISVELTSGWNYIANPYNFDIPVTSLSLSDGLFTYTNDGWTPIETTENLKPWEGYSVWVDSSVKLKITFPKASNSGLLKNKFLSENSWSLRIRAQCQQAIDLHNYAGIHSDASETWDLYDRLKPPPIGDYVRIYFPHWDWPLKANIYCADYRPDGLDIYEWDFEVNSTIRDLVYLTFEKLDEIPANFDVWILHKKFNRVQNLREHNKYQFANCNPEQKHTFTLLVGESNLINNQLKNAVVVPTRFDLFHNFPNPFNIITGIYYTIPHQEKVTLKIYNIYGQEVMILLNNEYRETGYHIEYWNGRDQNGQRVASGIYVYRIEVGNHYESKKMIMIK